MSKRLLATTALALALALPAYAQTASGTSSSETQEQVQQQPTTDESSGSTGATTSESGSMSTDTQTQSSGDVTQPSQPTVEDQAETTAPAPDTGTADVESSDQPIIGAQESGQWRAEKVIGATVTNAEDEDVGDVKDLLLDEDGRVVGVILSVGGFLGIGDKDVAVAWDQIELADGGEKVLVNMTKQQIGDAPAFETREELAINPDAAAPAAPPAGGETAPATGSSSDTGTTTTQ
jgi:sporulation protein YlmC with PRC-barrel domain